MFGFKKINRNPAEQQVQNFMTMTNAVAKQRYENGDHNVQFLSAQNAKGEFKSLIKSLIALATPSNEKHNLAFNAFGNELKNKNGSIDMNAMNNLESLGEEYVSKITSLASAAQKNGIMGKDAIEAAYNSVMGNPVFDQFANLNLLSDNLFEEQTIMESFLDNGDSFAVPMEPGNTGTAVSRFRVPVEFISGSPKTYQGDINPTSNMREDANRLQENISQEFKDAKTIEQPFSITQDQRNQQLGFAESIRPSLAGLVLQNRYAVNAQKMIMKLAELESADGTNAQANYTPNVGGSYGLLSTGIQFHLSDWDQASPVIARGSDFAANPTKLIQKIQNFYAKPVSVAAPLPASLAISDVYKDIVRLFSLIAQNNVNFQPRQWTLFVPTSFYALAVNFGTSGTFNKNLTEMILSATQGKIIAKIEILPSSLFDYRAKNAYGSTAGAYNYIMAVPQGSPNGKKAIIMPGQTSVPIVVSQHTNAQIMDFQCLYSFGGPMVTQLSGAYILEFSKAA